MKRKAIITLITAALACHTLAFADDSHINNGSGNGNGGTIVVGPGRGDKGTRPKAPSRQQIECNYDGSILYLKFTYSEGEAELTITDHTSGDIMSYSFSTDAPASILIGDIASGHIAITTSLDNTYEGFIE